MTKCRFPTLAKAPGREEAERDKQGSEGGIAAILALPGTHWLLQALYFLLHRHVAMEPIQATAIWPLANKISVLARALQWISLKGTPSIVKCLYNWVQRRSRAPALHTARQRTQPLVFYRWMYSGISPWSALDCTSFFFHSKCRFILEKKNPTKENEVSKKTNKITLGNEEKKFQTLCTPNELSIVRRIVTVMFGAGWLPRFYAQYTLQYWATTQPQASS